MARTLLIIAFGAAAIVASPVPAAQHDQVPAAAPAGDANTQYCMRIEVVTGSRLEEVKCWTRQEWAEQEVDVDKEWAKEGVAVVS